MAKQRKCPYKGDLCYDYGECETCTWNKIIVQRDKYKLKYKECRNQLTQATEALKILQADFERLRDKAKFCYEKAKSYGIENLYDAELERGDD